MKRKNVKLFFNHQRKGKSSATVNLDSAQSNNDQTTLQLEPKAVKSGYFDDLLKKYGRFMIRQPSSLGGFCQTATQSDVQNDIIRIREALA
jgi:hypothetical protein